MYTWQQARAEIVRAALHGYSRDQLLELVFRLSPTERIPHDCSVVSLAYKLAWRLLPASPDRRVP